MPVQYVPEGYKLYRSPVKMTGPSWNRLLPGQGQDGYGRKITTDIVCQLPGEQRQYRVYATCFSNVASHWILWKGQRLHLRDTDTVEKEHARDNATQKE